MIVPYLEVGKIIVSKNGSFEIKETEEGYELWDAESNHWLLNSHSINSFREDIGEVIKILNKK